MPAYFHQSQERPRQRPLGSGHSALVVFQIDHLTNLFQKASWKIRFIYPPKCERNFSVWTNLLNDDFDFITSYFEKNIVRGPRQCELVRKQGSANHLRQWPSCRLRQKKRFVYHDPIISWLHATYIFSQRPELFNCCFWAGALDFCGFPPIHEAIFSCDSTPGRGKRQRGLVWPYLCVWGRVGEDPVTCRARRVCDRRDKKVLG